MASECLARARTALDGADWLQVSQQLQQWLLATEVEPSQPIQAVRLAIAALQSGDFHAGWEIAKLLPRFGAIALPPLIALLNDPSADFTARWFAARSLGDFDAPEALAALVRLLQTTTDDDLAAAAGRTLADCGQRALPVLIDLLHVPDKRLLATGALAQLSQPEAIAPLLTVARDPEVEIRATAIAGLSRFRDPRLPALFLAALDDPAASVRKEAVSALGLWRARADELNLAAHLQPCLHDANLAVCQQAAIALSRLNTPAAAAALSDALHRPAVPVSVQRDLARALGWLTIPQRFDYLQQALVRLPETAVRVEVIRSLSRATAAREQVRASCILADWFATQRRSPDHRAVKQALAQAWGQLSVVSAQPHLENLQADSDVSVRLHAAAALAGLSATATASR